MGTIILYWLYLASGHCSEQRSRFSFEKGSMLPSFFPGLSRSGDGLFVSSGSHFLNLKNWLKKQFLKCYNTYCRHIVDTSKNVRQLWSQEPELEPAPGKNSRSGAASKQDGSETLIVKSLTRSGNLKSTYCYCQAGRCMPSC